MPFWDHLEELRWRIIKSLGTILICSIISYYYWEVVLGVLIQPSENLKIDLNLQVLSVTSMFIVKLSCSILCGIMLALPVLFYQFWRFVAPAFKSGSKFTMVVVTIFASLFFTAGISFGYFIIIPFSLGFFTNMTTSALDVSYNFTLENYLYYILWLLFISGLIFQLPVISYFFTRIGILTPAFLRHYRKYAFVSFLIIGAVLTPPDPISQIMVVIPLILLYEFSIFIAMIFGDRVKTS